MLNWEVLISALIFALIVQAASVRDSCSKTILYLPLDERFTTRDAFLNLAEITPYCILTPNVSILPSLKVPADLPKIDAWMDSNINNADALIISAEMYLYGGLIASRISNDSTNTVLNRLNKLLSYGREYPSLKILVSNVVMRIPSYNGDFEEPWYWKDYGADLFTYSFYTDKFEQLNNTEDLQTALQAKQQVPDSAVNEFVWRRQRNHNVTMAALRAMSKHQPFQHFYTTLDDSAEYGFNIREAAEIRNYIASPENKLSTTACPVYPGADEVHLVMLARYAVGEGAHGIPTLAAVFRDPSKINSIPGYEGQLMIDTLTQQIAAAGASLVDGSMFKTSSAVLMVNNFSEDNQQEASQQISSGDTDEFSCFDAYIDYVVESNNKLPIALCDNRYANGADRMFVQYFSQRLAATGLGNVAYAGWNTNGNTIGTVVANAVLLSIFTAPRANAAFNSLRLLEDMSYQADIRQTLVSYVNLVTNTDENTSNLAPDLDFYERFSLKTLSARYDEFATTFDLPWRLADIYYPWNRTFEIGLHLEDKSL